MVYLVIKDNRMLKCKRIDGIWFVSFKGYTVGTGFTCSGAIQNMEDLAESLTLKAVTGYHDQIAYEPMV